MSTDKPLLRMSLARFHARWSISAALLLWTACSVENAETEANPGIDSPSPRAERLLVLGDSYTAERRGDDSLEQRLEIYGAERNLELLNTSKHGFGPANYYAEMRHADSSV